MCNRAQHERKYVLKIFVGVLQIVPKPRMVRKRTYIE